ncbi:hypothetical protein CHINAEXTREME_15890 [Halobiforma lacisalsi AJ5]|uniref:Uncharacterized protein n=1 Tax=Natronobacterium lacisalsi AJ5 TaxID=358396 RepID=M0LE60_NATLA|nr:hypothetical protein [Halobiforma lacisalsi]APW99158.1 hypothetical protein CHINAEXTREME_15890 [Halobiforma lacisalsi AJ5]EMA30724.1 hypothetical protein C445_15486 [Halobiforma lacisalsi AJ5]
MTEQPPSPPSPGLQSPTAIESDDADASSAGPIVVTTTQLATTLQEWLGNPPDEDLLETLLLELDRRDFLECVGVTRDGDYRWNVTGTPERVGDAIAEAVVSALRSE